MDRNKRIIFWGSI